MEKTYTAKEIGTIASMVLGIAFLIGLFAGMILGFIILDEAQIRFNQYIGQKYAYQKILETNSSSEGYILQMCSERLRGDTFFNQGQRDICADLYDVILKNTFELEYPKGD